MGLRYGEGEPEVHDEVSRCWCAGFAKPINDGSRVCSFLIFVKYSSLLNISVLTFNVQQRYIKQEIERCFHEGPDAHT